MESASSFLTISFHLRFRWPTCQSELARASLGIQSRGGVRHRWRKLPWRNCHRLPSCHTAPGSVGERGVLALSWLRVTMLVGGCFQVRR